MTNPVGDRKLRTVAILPEQDAEMENFASEISQITGRNYPVSELMRLLITLIQVPKFRAHLLQAARKGKGAKA